MKKPLLSSNKTYRKWFKLSGEDIKGLITFLYYKNLEKAIKFYEEIMGFKLAIDQGWSKIYSVAEGAYIGLVDENRGYHRASATKPVIVCLNVADVDLWYSKLKKKGVENISQPSDSEELKIRAFILQDPEGYVIEIQESL